MPDKINGSLLGQTFLALRAIYARRPTVTNDGAGSFLEQLISAWSGLKTTKSLIKSVNAMAATDKSTNGATATQVFGHFSEECSVEVV